MKKYGLDAAGVVAAVEKLTGQTLDIRDDELTSVAAPRAETAGTADAAKAEDL